jgi:hypothetical protein
MACLSETRTIYNEMFEALKAQYETDSAFPTKYDMAARSYQPPRRKPWPSA